MVYQSTRLGGISEGIAGLDDLRTQRAENRKKRAEARQKQMEADIQLQNEQRLKEKEKAEIDNEIATLKAQTAAAIEQHRIFRTDATLDRYYVDSDSRHFNDFFNEMNNNSLIKSSLFKTVNNATNLSYTQENLKLLIDQGLDKDIAERIINTPELSNQFLVLTHENGNKGLLNVDDWAMGAGYFSRKTNREIDQALKRAEVLEKSAKAGDWLAAQELIGSGEAKNLFEALTMVEEGKSRATQAGKATTPTELDEQKIQARMKETGESYMEAVKWLENLGKSDPSPSDQVYQKFVDEGIPEDQALEQTRLLGKGTSTQKELVQANKIRDDLENLGIYDSGFDMNKLPEKEQINLKGQVLDLMKLSGNQITNEERKFLRELGPLVSLAGEVTEDLTPVQTGLLDRFLDDVGKYISDNVEAVNASSAYKEFRNLSRHILMGSQITEHEIKAYNEASGWLGQQFVPVMTQFLVKLKTHTARLDALSNITEPSFAPVFLGKTSGRLQVISDQLQDKIDFYTGKLDIENSNLGDLTDKKTVDQPATDLDSIEKEFNL